jgi:hypothetical protein
MQNLQNIMKSVGKLPTGGFPAATRLGAAHIDMEVLQVLIVL